MINIHVKIWNQNGKDVNYSDSSTIAPYVIQLFHILCTIRKIMCKKCEACILLVKFPSLLNVILCLVRIYCLILLKIKIRDICSSLKKKKLKMFKHYVFQFLSRIFQQGRWKWVRRHQVIELQVVEMLKTKRMIWKSFRWDELGKAGTSHLPFYWFTRVLCCYRRLFCYRWGQSFIFIVEKMNRLQIVHVLLAHMSTVWYWWNFMTWQVCDIDTWTWTFLKAKNICDNSHLNWILSV